ncbi:protein TALPID3 [Electrophorus electricus]|uniref:protein TALPID3 n=1 Tax=Electrophorus electricus TaxID=8005 RepID=UPI0015D03882|nr:protein TALPID3 [Electrophorus electricus]
MPSTLSGGPEEQDYTASKQALGVARNSHVPRVGKSTGKPSFIQTRDREQKGQDVLISRYSTDGRGAVVAALKQRSHSAPVRREVEVQLLGAGPSPSVGLQSTEVQQPSPAFPAGNGGTATAVAAITAAAIAATAPVIQAQSEMEVRVAQVASELRRLQEAEGQGSRAGGRGADRAPDKTAQLEEQLITLTQLRLQHLERIQDQQLELQNRLLGSALDAVAARSGSALLATRSAGQGRAVPESAQRPGLSLLPAGDGTAAVAGDSAVQDHSMRTWTGWVKSPLETPAPRKVIPKPTHWIPTAHNPQPSNQTHKATKKSYGDGRPLEWIPISQRSPTRSSARSAGARGVAVATVNDTEPKQFRENPPKASVCPAGRSHPDSTLIKPACQCATAGTLMDAAPLTRSTEESSRSAVQQASAMLQDLSRLKEEMRNVLRPSELGDVVPPRVAPLSRASMPPPASMFEDAGCVLKQVRRGRKVLEENLQAILRAKDGEVLHTQLEALATNRDAREELRVRKTVDAWISTLTKEIEDELAPLGSAAERAPAAPRVQGGGGGARTRRAGPKGKGAVAAASRRPALRAPAPSRLPPGQHHTSSLRSDAEQHAHAPTPPKSDDDEAYLEKVYGRALYEGQRRTLKKGPYLRFSSPVPKPKVQRPKLIESVKGVKMKSSKTQTQTSSSGVRAVSSGPQYLFSPSSPVQQEQLVPGSPLRGFLIPMAIPLGEPRVDGQVPLPSRVIISDKPAIVTTSFLPTPAPESAPPIHKPNTVLLEVCSTPKRPAPQLQIQVQPSVNIESITGPSPAPSPPLLPSPPIQQESELEADAPGSPVELNGLPSPPAAMYHGPAFPPQPAPPTPLPELGLRTGQHTHTLEGRLLDWVEQQLMARVISGMFSPQDPANQSEPAESVTSCMAEATRHGGQQQVVHAGLPVDSELVRRCVNEVLAEIIAATLGQSHGPEAAGPPETAAQDTHTQETAIPTPVPTPEPSERDSPASNEALPPGSALAQSPTGSQPARPQEPASPVSEKTPVDTPASTPVPSPDRLATPSPPPELPSLRNHPWGEAELPLKEEDPHSEEEELGPPPIVLSVAHEEEVEAVILPSFPVPPEPQRLPSAVEEEPPPAPPESLSGDDSSSWSSPTLTETETAARHISEGEVLLSSGQMAVIRALEEEGLALPNPLTSFNSSLHGVHDMDYDPPSEGQVIRRPLVPANHDPVLSLLARMEQGPASQSQQPEQGCWDEESSGELSEGQRPLLTTLQQRVVTGHSLLPTEPSGQDSVEQSPHTTLNSPGQLLTQFTGQVTPAEDSGLPVNVKPTEEHTQTSDTPPPQPGDSTHQQCVLASLPLTVSPASCVPPRGPALILVKQCQPQLETGAEASLQASSDGRLISITLPTVQSDDWSPSVSTMEGDSHSASDVFL